MNKKKKSNTVFKLNDSLQPVITQTTAHAPMTLWEQLFIGLTFLAIFSLYLSMLISTTPAGDSSELISSAYILGVPHPPGYPLFMLLGKLFSFFPFGSVVWRINLSAAVFNLGAAFFIYLSLNKLVNYWPAALLGAVFFATSPLVWEYSLKAEVFSLNNLFASLIVYLLILLHKYSRQYQTQELEEKNYIELSRKLFYLIFFTCGLALTNHHTIILILPGVSIFLFSYCKQHFLTYRTLFIALALFFLALCIYLYIPVRASAEPFLNWDDAKNVDGFFNLITRSDYGSLKLMNTSATSYNFFERYGIYLSSVIKQFNPVGVIVALFGVLFLVKNGTRILSISLLLIYMCCSFIFFALANLPNTNPLFLGVFERFYMLPNLFLALFIGFGVYALHQWTRGRKLWAYLLNGGILFSVLISLMYNYSQLNKYTNPIIHNYGINVLKSVEPNALILTHGDINSNTLDNVQLVYKLRPDLVILDQEKLTYPWYCKQMRKNYPEITIPFFRYDGQKGKLIHLIEANIHTHSIYLLGLPKEESIFLNYRLMPYGLVRKVVNKNYWPDTHYAQENEHLWATFHLHQLKQDFPMSSFEYEAVTNYALSLFYLGWEYHQNKWYDLAIREYEHAIKINPLLAESYKNLAIIYTHFKPQKDKALKMWTTYVALNPHDKDIDVIRSWIKSN